MKKYRLYTSEGVRTISGDGIKVKKSKNGLMIIFKDKSKIDGVVLMTEIQESEVVVASPQNSDNQFTDDEEVV